MIAAPAMPVAAAQLVNIGYALVGALMLLIAMAIAAVPLRRRAEAFIASTGLLVFIALLSLYLLGSGANLTVLSVFHLYAFSEFFVALFCVGLVLVNTLSYRYYSNYTGFLLFFAFAVVGMLIVPMANSLVTVLLGLELMAIPTSFMIVMGGKGHIEAAVKLFVLSAIAVGAFAFAIALMLPYEPGLGLYALTSSSGIGGNYLVLLAIILLIGAMGFEVAAFPFNLWIPDVYEGAPGSVTALLAGINKKVAFVALMEVLFIVFANYATQFALMLAFIAILTMFYGNLLAMVQTNVKRLFAYSSISQAGYILIGMAAATQLGIEASLFQITAHVFMIIGAFAIVLWLETQNIKSLDDYGSLASRNGFAAAALTILMLSMAGIPPLLGFFGKFLLFSSAVFGNLVYLAVIGIINSFISIYYYAKVIDRMYRGGKQKSALRIDSFTMAVVLVALIVVIVLGLYPQLLMSAASAASGALLSV
ncbi:MAG: NADH-quinone oxidoreductase subunit N [Candidatus Marsarchaeota archaeon]|nr:NADH-quinone oxidoreductase subunit N [Candidatus Marsarchaeota archaeon]